MTFLLYQYDCCLLCAGGLDLLRWLCSCVPDFLNVLLMGVTLLLLCGGFRVQLDCARSLCVVY